MPYWTNDGMRPEDKYGGLMVVRYIQKHRRHNVLYVNAIINYIRYGVVANISRSHRGAQGSIPCTGGHYSARADSFCTFSTHLHRQLAGDKI